MWVLALVFAADACIGPLAAEATAPAHRVSRTITRHHAPEDVEASPSAIQATAYEITGELPHSKLAQTAPVSNRPAPLPPSLPAGTMAACALLVAALMGTVMLKRKRKPMVAAIEIISQQSLSAKHKLTVVKVGNQQMLLGVSDGGIRLLSVIAGAGSATVVTPQSATPKSETFDTTEFETILAGIDIEVPAISTATETDGIIRLREARERRAAAGRSA